MISGQYFSSMPAASAWLDPKPLPPLPPLPTASPGAEEEQAVEVEVSDDWYADDDEWNAARLGEAPGDDQQPAAAYVAPRAPYRKENYRPNRQRSGPRRRVLRGGAENSEGERSGTESEESEDEECQLLRLKTVSNHRRLRKDEECELLRLREILRGGNLLRRREDGDPSAGQLSAKTSVSPSVKIETELDAELDSHSAKQAAFDLAGFACQPTGNGPAAGKKRLMIEDRETVDARHAPDLTVHGNSDSEPDRDFMNRLHDPVNMAHHSFVQHVARLAHTAGDGDGDGDPIDSAARFENAMLALFDGNAATTSARRRHCLRTALKMYTEQVYQGQLLKAQLRAQEARFARVRTYREAACIAELQTQLEDAHQLTQDMLQAGSAQAPGPKTRQRSKMRKLF